MANVLTGDFDVVAEFALPTTNRVLAAMHRCERLLHSITARVDDNPRRGSVIGPVVVGAVDSFGDFVVNQNQVGKPNPFPGSLVATSAIYAGLDIVVNTIAGATLGTTTPSHLQGVAQMQLAPPTIEVPDSSGQNIRLRLPVMARYFPDPDTSPVAEFIRGEVQLTTALTQVVSQKIFRRYIDVNLQADNLIINFVSLYPSLSAEDLAGINLLIRNALRTSFVPSTEQLPDQVAYLHIRPLSQGPGAIGVLLKMASPDPTVYVADGNPSTVNTVFLDAGDDFAFALGKDFIEAVFKPFISNIGTQATSLYSITINQATVDLQSGEIVVTFTGSASGHRWWTINFNFTVSLRFTLQANGDTVDLVAKDISENDVDTDSFWVNNFGKGRIVSAIKDARDQALTKKDANGNDAYAKVNQLFSANTNLGKFLSALLNPAHPQPGVPPQQDVFILLWYNSVDIQTAGIVLHGSLAVGDWPPAHVEYQPVPAATSAHVALPHGQDYSALKTWIPGGLIQQYEWSYQGQAQPFHIDVNKFVLLGSDQQVNEALAFAETVSGAVSGYTSLCVTIKGSRLSSSGPVVAQPVTASMCGYNRFPIISGVNLAANGKPAMVALAQPGPDGMVQVAGHTAAQVDPSGRNTPNVIVHFADQRSAGNLEVLTLALSDSGRKAAVLAVLAPEQYAKTRYTQGVVYGAGGEWERVFGVETPERPVTLIAAAPNGKVVWTHEGEVNRKTLADALRKNLGTGGPVTRDWLGLNLRIGRLSPNFFFDLVPGHSLTLRKLTGRAVVLVFWRSTSGPSLEAVRDLQETNAKSGPQGPVVLAINDGEPLEVVSEITAEKGLTATIVSDANRMISVAYGVSIWPTMVFLDASGVVTGIRYGHTAGERVASPAEQKLAASR
jgi:peroxiredoxin